MPRCESCKSNHLNHNSNSSESTLLPTLILTSALVQPVQNQLSTCVMTSCQPAVVVTCASMLVRMTLEWAFRVGQGK